MENNVLYCWKDKGKEWRLWLSDHWALVNDCVKKKNIISFSLGIPIIVK